MIDQDHLGVGLARGAGDLLRLAAADEVARLGPLAPSGNSRHRLGSRRARELLELLEIERLDRRPETQAHEHRALRRALAVIACAWGCR